MGGAQPLAVTMNDGVALVIEVDPARIRRRLETRYLDEAAASIDQAIDRALDCRSRGIARSIGLEANAADILPELVERGLTPDVVTDQTSAHDALNGYVPNGMTLDAAARLRTRDPGASLVGDIEVLAPIELTIRCRRCDAFNGSEAVPLLRPGIGARRIDLLSQLGLLGVSLESRQAGG
jgi:hypothetical protein